MAAEQLLVTEGTERGALLAVENGLLLGRLAPEQEGRLGGDLEISRRHARLSRGPRGELTIEDLGSANGTFVNGERIDAPRPLVAGDVIGLGRTVLKVVAGSRSPTEVRAPAPAGSVLVVSTGTLTGQRLELGDELEIGRDVSGQGRLSDDLEVSRLHARLTRGPGGEVMVEDLGSANGTFVNGERVHGKHPLKVGDSLRIGTTTLELRGGEPVREEPAVPPAPRAPAMPAKPPAPDLLPALPLGSVFAGCRIEEVIGHGDMGIVYRAEELALQRPVALKVILPAYSEDDRFRERFRRESKIAAAIDHPNVIPVFDAGEEDGVLYIMMRLVEGTDLRALIAAQGPLEPLRAARIVQQVGAALDAAHSRGMLHRDVKPSNVLLARRDHVYLTDFGLAKRADSGEGLTRHGTIVARAEYVSPEQILNRRVDARADIYALTCVLFEALTGEPPFTGSSGGGDPLAHLEAPRPSPRDLRPDLPPEFDEVVRRGMAKEPEERYPSGGDLGQAALVAAGGLRRASGWSIVATGEAAPVLAERPDQQASRDSSAQAVLGDAGGRDVVRWAIAIAGLLVVAAGMVAALIGISSL